MCAGLGYCTGYDIIPWSDEPVGELLTVSGTEFWKGKREFHLEW